MTRPPASEHLHGVVPDKAHRAPRQEHAAPISPATILLTVEQAAEQLTIGRTTLYALIRTGDIPSVRIGKLRRLRPADLTAYATQLSA
ncbi:helix-turn-helix domain-containing protein [Candidatus Frankia nodulisporulans]|uniref:helix-turn-helix domain-containing protein n=1 Tax=Candidatus Frankia nodulisporulans TaxID=2060052 RepID=UPI001CDC109D|nr:helix-turn-helix domain-containing protein [Candidatus Frankia nodulisporulans]